MKVVTRTVWESAIYMSGYVICFYRGRPSFFQLQSNRAGNKRRVCGIIWIIMKCPEKKAGNNACSLGNSSKIPVTGAHSPNYCKYSLVRQAKFLTQSITVLESPISTGYDVK